VPFFARLASQFEKKSTIMTLKIFFDKNKKVSEFHADFKSVEIFFSPNALKKL
jgi:hypothetical protein